MHNFSTGLHISARADGNTSSTVCLAQLEHQHLLITIEQLIRLLTKRYVVVVGHGL